jgi:hypothetical protein
MTTSPVIMEFWSLTGAALSAHYGNADDLLVSDHIG